MSSRHELYLLAMTASDMDLNLSRSFTTLLPKNVVPSSRVGSYTTTVAPLALIRFMTPCILLWRKFYRNEQNRQIKS